MLDVNLSSSVQLATSMPHLYPSNVEPITGIQPASHSIDLQFQLQLQLQLQPGVSLLQAFRA